MTRSALAYAPNPKRDPTKLTAAELDTHRAEQNRAAQLDVARSLDERKALPSGADIEHAASKRGEGLKPARRVTGLDYLLAKRLIDARQREAGEKYGARVQAGSPGVGSCLDIRESVGMPSTAPYTLAEVVSYAKAKLRDDRAGGLRNNPRLVAICDAVCGLGQRPSDLAFGDRSMGDRYLAWLQVALDLLADHYGL